MLFRVISLVLVFAAFFTGYHWTEVAFRQRLIPYPFELFGVAAGAGLAFWVYGLFDFLKGFLERRS